VLEIQDEAHLFFRSIAMGNINSWNEFVKRMNSSRSVNRSRSD